MKDTFKFKTNDANDTTQKQFTVKYYNKALNENHEKSFSKKNEALIFINNLLTLQEIRNVKLFKTKQIAITINELENKEYPCSLCE